MSHGISPFTQEYSQNQYKLLEWLLNICFERPDTSNCIKCVKDLFGDGKVTEIYSGRLIQQVRITHANCFYSNLIAALGDSKKAESFS